MACFSLKVKLAAWITAAGLGATAALFGAVTEVTSAGVTTIGSVPAMVAGLGAMATSLMFAIATLDELLECANTNGLAAEVAKLQARRDALQGELDRINRAKSICEGMLH